MVKTITFTQPPASIADLAPTLQAGGSLAIDTFYYVVCAVAGNTLIYSSSQVKAGISNEVSATTDASNKTIRLDWTAIPGAVGYYVFRATSSDVYTGSKRFRRETDNHSSYVTTTNNFFIDAGAATPALYRTSYIPVAPASFVFPDKVDPRTYGEGRLTLSGGDSGDPITLQNIYDDAVANAWTDWCKYDRKIFTLMGHFYINSADTYFEALNQLLNLFDNIYFKSIGGSLKFGTIDANGSPTDGCEINNVCAYSNQIYFYVGTKMYATKLKGNASSVSSPYYLSGIIATHYIKPNGGIFDGVSLTDFSLQSNQVDIFMKNLNSATAYWMPLYNDTLLLQGLICTYHYPYYSANNTMDRIKCMASSYQVRMRRINNDIQSMHHIDGEYPNTPDTDGLPVIYWGNATVYTSHFNLWHSFRLKVNAQGNALANVKVTIKDKDGNIAEDKDGTEVKAFTTDAYGNLWAEKINITAVTDNTITDSSKSWTTDKWKGRNLYIVSGNGKGWQVKILSNTGTVLTLCEDFITNPSVSDQAGIILWIKRVKMMHKAGTGAGTGDAYTTTTLYTPHELTIYKDGYETYKADVEINRPMDLDIKLRHSPSVGRDEMGDDIR